jgi:hypothetical protein
MLDTLFSHEDAWCSFMLEAVDSKTKDMLKGCQLKYPLTSMGIEPMTSWLCSIEPQAIMLSKLKYLIC